MKNTYFKTKRGYSHDNGDCAEIYYKGQLVGKVTVGVNCGYYNAEVNTTRWSNSRTANSNNPLSVGIEWVKRQVKLAHTWID